MAEVRKNDPLEEAAGVSLGRRSELLVTGGTAIFVAGIDREGRPQITPAEAVDLAAFVLGEALSQGLRTTVENCANDSERAKYWYQETISAISKRISQQLAADRENEISAISSVVERARRQ